VHGIATLALHGGLTGAVVDADPVRLQSLSSLLMLGPEGDLR